MPSSTAGASSPEIRLWPYVPGVYRRDALYRVWALMEQDGETIRAFWDRASSPETCADLASFIKTFDGVPTTQLAMVEGPGGLIGCIWCSEIMIGHQAFISIWMRKDSRTYAQAAAIQAITHAFQAWELRQLWAITPWHNALALAVRLGFEHIATLPDYCRFPDRSYDAHVLRLTKETWHG